MSRPIAKRPEQKQKPQSLAEGQAQRLLKARADKKWSIRDLAEASSVAKGIINDIEKGRKERVSCYTMAALADALGVSRGWLAFGSEVRE